MLVGEAHAIVSVNGVRTSIVAGLQFVAEMVSDDRGEMPI